MVFDERAYSLEQLRDLQRQVGEAIVRRTAVPGAAPRAYRPGDKVTFWARGRNVVMEVNKVNPKTLGGVEKRSDGTTMRWRASPSLVKPYAETAMAPILSPIVELPDAAAPAVTPLTNKPSTAADAW